MKERKLQPDLTDDCPISDEVYAIWSEGDVNMEDLCKALRPDDPDQYAYELLNEIVNSRTQWTFLMPQITARLMEAHTDYCVENDRIIAHG